MVFVIRLPMYSSNRRNHKNSITAVVKETYSTFSSIVNNSVDCILLDQYTLFEKIKNKLFQIVYFLSPEYLEKS